MACQVITTLNAQLNPICHLLALLGAHHILHVSRSERVPPTAGIPYLPTVGTEHKYAVPLVHCGMELT